MMGGIVSDVTDLPIVLSPKEQSHMLLLCANGTAAFVPSTQLRLLTSSCHSGTMFQHLQVVCCSSLFS